MRISGRANQQLQATAGGPRSQKSSKDSASCDDGAQQLCLEIFGHEIGHSHWPPAQHAVHIALAKVAESTSSLQHAPKIAAAGVVDVGRRGGERSRDYFADLGQRFFELGILGRIFL